MVEKDKYNILYVDDEEANLRVFKNVFRRSYNVITTTSPKEGLDLFQKNEFHVVISDQRMPSMSGVDFLAAINKSNSFIPKMLLTGYTDYDELKKVLNKSEIHKYINKPFDVESLTTILELAIEGYLLVKEQQKMQAELTANEKKFREIFNSMADTFVRVSFDGSIQVISPSIEELSGYKSKDLIGKSIKDLYVKPEESHAIIKRVQEEKFVREIETAIYSKSGEKKYISFTAKLYYDEDNNPLGVEKIARDVTVKKMMEEAINEQNDLLYETQKIAKVGSWQYDVEARKAVWSETLCTMYGIDSFSSIENSLEGYINFIHPIDRSRVTAIISNSLKQAVDFSFDATIIKMGGEEREISFIGKLVVDNQKTLKKVTVACLDITDAKKKERDLINSEEKLRALTEQLPIRVLKTDRKLNVLYSNKLMDECFLTTERKEGSIYSFLHKDVLPFVLDVINKIDNSEETQYIEFEFYSMWFSLSASKVKGPIGTGEMLFIFENISEKKENELVLKNTNEALEAKVAKRTADLEAAKDKIEEAYEKEKELSKLKSQFVSTASHQFRTPLTVIQSSIGLLEMQVQQTNADFQEKFYRVHKRIQAEVKRMTGLMDNVLILGKKESGVVKAKFQMIDVLQLVNTIVLQHNEIQADGRVVKVSCSGSPSLYNVDPNLLEYAISNLVSNAIKYSEGKPSPQVHLHFKKSELLLTVEDFGVGIPEKELVNIFEPFYRAENVKDIAGTGLGTSIARAYIELMRGTLEVKSKVGKGSIFSINIEK